MIGNILKFPGGGPPGHSFSRVWGRDKFVPSFGGGGDLCHQPWGDGQPWMRVSEVEMLTTMYDAVRFNLDKKYETSFIRLSLIRAIGFV